MTFVSLEAEVSAKNGTNFALLVENRALNKVTILAFVKDLEESLSKRFTWCNKITVKIVFPVAEFVGGIRILKTVVKTSVTALKSARSGSWLRQRASKYHVMFSNADEIVIEINGNGVWNIRSFDLLHLIEQFHNWKDFAHF